MTNNSKNPKESKALLPKQLKAIDLLVSGMSCTDTAKEVGVHPSTISVWKLDEQFKSTLNHLLREQRHACREKLRSIGPNALETIQAIMQDDKASAKDRLTAAFKVVDMLGIEEDAKKKIGKPEPHPLLGNDPMMNLDMDQQMSIKDLENYMESMGANHEA